jgi:hypothetical protein
MCPNEKEIEHEFEYCGPHDSKGLKATDQNPVPPSPDRARIIALAVLNGAKGSYRPTVHCQDRMIERDFDVFDIEYVIRNGISVDDGRFVPEYKQHKYTFRGNIDGTTFDAAIALCAVHDLVESPRLILLSGCFKTKSGKRKKTF